MGIISAFNFPVAAWSWNAALAVVCGNSIIWKPSEKTPITAIACQKPFEDAAREVGGALDGLPQLLIGNPLDAGTLVGPLIDRTAYDSMQTALQGVAAAKVTGGERVLSDECPDACYVRAAIIEMPESGQTVQHETFASILDVYPYTDLQEAIRLQNDVPQGLSSAIFTNDLREAETFVSAAGSDCGIANINIGNSGAEIGGAFGGEKETGGGRESGSDAWKGYMRRATSTVNYSTQLPLAQGIEFDI